MIRLKTCVFASANRADRLLVPLLTRFIVIHLKSYTKEEFEVPVEILNGEEDIEKRYCHPYC